MIATRMQRHGARRVAAACRRPVLPGGRALATEATSVKAKREKAEEEAAAKRSPKEKAVDMLRGAAEAVRAAPAAVAKGARPLLKRSMKLAKVKAEEAKEGAAEAVPQLQKLQKAVEARLPETVRHYVRSTARLVTDHLAARRTRRRLATADLREEVTREELMVAMQTHQDTARAMAVLALAAVPVAGYILPVVYGMAAPDRLPRVFWTPTQARRFRPAQLLEEAKHRERYLKEYVEAAAAMVSEAAEHDRPVQYDDMMDPFWALMRRAARSPEEEVGAALAAAQAEAQAAAEAEAEAQAVAQAKEHAEAQAKRKEEAAAAVKAAAAAAAEAEDGKTLTEEELASAVAAAEAAAEEPAPAPPAAPDATLSAETTAEVTREVTAARAGELNALLAQSEGVFDTMLELSPFNASHRTLLVAYNVLARPAPGANALYRVAGLLPRRVGRKLLCRQIERRVDLLREDDRVLRRDGGLGDLSLAELRDACAARGVHNPHLERSLALELRHRKLRQWLKPGQLAGRAVAAGKRAVAERRDLARRRDEDPDAKPVPKDKREPLPQVKELAEVEEARAAEDKAETTFLRDALGDWLALTGATHQQYASALAVGAMTLKSGRGAVPVAAGWAAAQAEARGTELLAEAEAPKEEPRK